MHFRRFASLVLGGWLAGSLLLLALTAQNARIVDRLIRTPVKEAVDYMVKLQEADLRVLMNYHAEEANDWARQSWETVQLVLGVVVLLSLFLSTGGKRYTVVLCVLMICSVVFQHWFLEPQSQRLMQATVFVKPDQMSVERDRLRSLETGYRTTEILKLSLGALLAWGLIKRGRRHHREADVD